MSKIATAVAISPCALPTTASANAIESCSIDMPPSSGMGASCGGIPPAGGMGACSAIVGGMGGVEGGSIGVPPPPCG